MSLGQQRRFSLLSLLSLPWLFLLTFFSSTLAGRVEARHTRGLLRVGMSGDYQPFSMCSESFTDCRGFDVDVAQRLATDLGVQLEIVRFRWPELRSDLAAGKFDIAMSGVTIRPERALSATFTRPYTVASAVILVADAQRIPTVVAVDQAQIRLAVNAGGHLEQVARNHFHVVTLLPTPKNLSLPDLIEQKQADALLTDSLEAPHFLAAHPTLHALPSFGRDRKAYLLRRTDADLREWFDNWLLAHETDGFLGELRTRWFGHDAGTAPSPLAALFALIDLRLALMPAVADYKNRHNLPIEDVQQEQAVLARVAAQVHGSEVKVRAVQNLFRVQIELAKQVQRAVWQNQTEQTLVPTWAHGLDLNTDLRPVFLELSDRIVQELLRVPFALQQDHPALLRQADEEITVSAINIEARRQLGEALWKVGQSTEGVRIRVLSPLSSRRP